MSGAPALPDEELALLAARARESLGPLVYIDVGARDGLAGAWDALARAGLVQAYGFDPAAEHVAGLARRDAHVEYLPVAVGEHSGRARLVHTLMPGCSSFLEPNFDLLRDYPACRIFEVVGESEVEVRTLDELVGSGAVPAPRLLKLDTQGSELPILRGARRVLPHVVCIELETQFKPMYRGQALFPEVKAFLEEHGFILRQLRVNGPYEGEFLEADAFFSRRPALDANLDLIRLWEAACGVESPRFLAQMDDWLPEWTTYLTEDQRELRRRLFGPLR
jgi:FkbM family methyltransferase